MLKWLKNRSYRYHLNTLMSPTFYNLVQFLREQGWRSTRYQCLANISHQHFEFDSTIAEQLEFKHLLAQLVSTSQPQIMPVTHYIDDENWSSVLNHIADTHYYHNHQLLDSIENLSWILKPSLLNNGKHIKIFQNLSQLEQHYLNSHRLGGPHVLQQYITNPHLLKGHKYSIRMFVVLTNDLNAYLYPQGYFNVALHPYQAKEFYDLSSHLTNEHLNEDAVNVIQIPTDQFDFFPSIYQEIKTIVSITISALHKTYSEKTTSSKQNKLAIFGFDFCIDADKRVWLIEANHAPCFPTDASHPLQKHLYHDFWNDFVENFILPIAKNKKTQDIQHSIFEKINQA
jgi:hypothetical protein